MFKHKSTKQIYYFSCLAIIFTKEMKSSSTHKKNSIWWWEKCYNNGLLLLKYYILLLQQLNLDERNRKHWKKKICSLYLHRLCALPIDFWETLKKRNTHNILERMMNRNISWNKNWTSLTIKLKKRTKKFYYNYKYCFWTNSILEMFKRKSDSVITPTKKNQIGIFWLTESNLQLLPHIIKNDCTTTTRLFFLYFLIQVKTGIMMNFFEVLLLIKDTTKRIKLWIWCVHYFPICRKKIVKMMKR